MPAAPSIATEDLTTLVERLKEEWRAKTALPDAVGACREFPALARHRSLFVDLAYEQYCLQEEAGAAPNVDSFCRQLPAFRSQVREVLRGHREIADHPELLAVPAADWPKLGDTVERLQLHRELGRGAFARVYLAHDPDAHRYVALKLAPAPSVEPRTLGSLKHPHIGGLHWARPTTGNLHALCMPFVGAATLVDVVEAAFNQGRPPSARAILEATAGVEPLPPVVTDRMTYPRAVAAIGARLADALAHLHKAGIAHGDLKPSNVLLGSGGHPYLIDFNLAGGPEASRLRCGGTLPYMAPERIRLLLDPTAGPADPIRADIYSFGALLFELTTGGVPLPPVESLDQGTVAKDLLSRTPPSVRTCRRQVPAALARLIDRCLSTDPARRPTSEELSGRLAGLAQPSRLLNRTTVAALVVAVVCAVVGIWLVGRASGAVDPTALSAAVQSPLHQARAIEAPASEPPTPKTCAEHFALGVKLLAGDEPSTAAYHFALANPKGRNPKAAAFQAHCLVLTGRPAQAADLFLSAVEGGYAEPWVHNNRAYTLLGLGKEANRLGEVVNHASAAVDHPTARQAALYNRARAYFQIDLNRKTMKLDHQRAVDDIRKAFPAGPVGADELFHTALILAAGGESTNGGEAVILRYLERSVNLGYQPTALVGHPVFRHHLSSAGLSRIAAVPRSPVEQPRMQFGLLPPAE